MFYKEIEFLKEWIERDTDFVDIASYGLRKTSAEAEVLLKSNFVVISGCEVLQSLLHTYGIEGEFYYENGEVIRNDGGIKRVAILKGNAYSLLTVERTMLNVLSMMSGIATKTYRIVKKIEESSLSTRVSATRKTIPGVGYLQKLAVFHGGGDTHRWNLSDTVMLKDNHIKLYGGIKRAVEEAKKYTSFIRKIECEVKNEEEALIALEAGVDIIMLDNFKAEDAKKTAAKLKDEKEDIVVEVSGGIGETNFMDYLSKDIDVISMGSLTTEIEYRDFSMEII